MPHRERVFMPNNIQLREVTSLCISKYKSSQSNALNQLQSSSAHVFSSTAREILLLKYDMWFKWLLEIEELARSGVVDIATVAIIVSDRIEDNYLGVLSKHIEVFNEEFVAVWIDVHKLIYYFLKDKIRTLSSLSVKEFFIEVTSALILVMDNTLFELQEIDNLFYGGKPFISFDDICYDYDLVNEVPSCLLTLRLDAYARHFDFGKDIIIKDYSKRQDLLQDAQPSVLSQVEAAGYNVVKVI